MSSRSFRLETRSRARDEIKRIMQTVEKVRKWEKIWIETGLSNHLQVYKWVPVREENKKEEEKQEKEEVGSKAKTEGAAGESNTDSALPEILPSQELSSSLDSSQLSAAAAMPPDLLLESESKPAPSDPSSAVTRDTARDEGQQQEADLEKRKERQETLARGVAEDENRPRSPH